jgi:hypothetical protein
MPESVSRLWELTTQSVAHLTMGELILRIALICCTLFATVQLLSMVGTHYGDRNAVSKSFFLSLLLHCCLGLGWVTVVDPTPEMPGTPGEPEEQSVRVTLSNDSADGDSSPTAGTSSRPVWDSGVQPLERGMTRTQRLDTQRPDQEMTPIDEPVVEKSPTPDPIVLETPELQARPETAAPTPTQQSVASTATVAPAQPSDDVEEPVNQARPEAGSVSTGRRQQVSRESSNTDLAMRVEPQRGAAERIGPLIEDGAVLTLPNELSPEATIPKPIGPAENFIRQRANPSPVIADVADNGSSPTSSASKTVGDRRTSQFTRSGSRNGAETELESTPAPRSNSVTTSITSQQIAAARPTLGSDFANSSSGSNFNSSPKPQLSRPASTVGVSRTPTRDPETYRARRIEQRRAAALKNGGSVESERAVEASLKWMASVQEPTGFWSAARHGGGAAKNDPQGQNRLDGGLYADSGITGLVVLSYLGAGYTHQEGKYADVVKPALKWLIDQQNANGYLGGKATRYDMMYCHAIATFAIAEAYGMQSDPNSFPELGDAVRNAIRLICAMQNDDGGWRYGKGGESDMSMFGWQLMALKSAVNAGIPVPDETRRGMTKFLQARALGTRGGLAGYKLNESPSPAMTAEALFCRQMFNVRPRDGASQEAVSYLRNNLPRLSVYDEYYWYYGTLAMFQQDGQGWEEWNRALRDTLVGLQRTQGPLAGSWDPNGKWAGIGGRLYSTAVSTMSLEVYYRFLRIYQSNEE